MCLFLACKKWERVERFCLCVLFVWLNECGFCVLWSIYGAGLDCVSKLDEDGVKMVMMV